MRPAPLLVALCLALPAPAQAQEDDPPAMPPGHPLVAPPRPAPQPLPPGHPVLPAEPPRPADAPTPDALPPGHPPAPVALPPGHPPAATGGPTPAGQNHMAHVMGPPRSGTAEASDEVPVGTVSVLVVDENGDPIPDAAVNMGSLASGERTRWNERTNDEGVATFDDLPTGNAQAYRVNVPFMGATYSTAPFALPTAGGGFSVRITRLPVTQEDRFVFFRVFRVIIELRGERMHVIQQGALTNAGSATYVFPASGRRAALPEDATAFQFQRVMTDQRVEEIAGQNAYVLRGSLPPGTVNLAWGYDLPVSGGDLEILVEFPMRFFGLQVIAEAIPDLDVEVSGGLPAMQRLDTQGEPCRDSVRTEGCAWITQIRRSPTDAEISSITIHLSGIPGPGPVRWIAVVLLIAFLFAGAILFVTAGRKGSPAAARKQQRRALQEEAEVLAEELESGEVGPQYHARRRAEIVRELATLLYAGAVSRAREDEEANVVEIQRSGVSAYLAPRPDAAPGARNLEIALTILSAPLLILGAVAVLIRPQIALRMGGTGEVIISLTLGTAGAVGAWLIGELALGWPPAATWSAIAVMSVALFLRTIIRMAAPARETTRAQ